MSGGTYDHTDPDTLRELYHNRGLSLRDVADKCGVSHGSVLYQMDQHGIETCQYHTPDDAVYKDKGWLEKQYWDNNLSLSQIAEQADVHRGTIHKWMKKLGVERRTSYTDQVHASTFVDTEGYVRWRHRPQKHTRTVAVHRLLAVAEYGFDAVSGMDVHHTTNIPWDNRPDAIELLSREDHARRHGKENVAEQRKLMNQLRDKGKL